MKKALIAILLLILLVFSQGLGFAFPDNNNDTIDSEAYFYGEETGELTYFIGSGALSSISGKVVDSETGLQIKDVIVKLGWISEGDEVCDYLELTAKTNAKGNFAFKNLPSGEENYYYLTFSNELYLTNCLWEVYYSAEDIYLEVELSQGSGYLLGGKVIDRETGLPIEDVRVELYWQHGDEEDSG